MWNYKCDKYFSKPLWDLIGICKFFLNLSWTYAHYRNGSFPKPLTIGDVTYPPRLFFKEQSFWKCVKNAWKDRHND